MKTFYRYVLFSLKLWWPAVILWEIKKGRYDGRMPSWIATGTIALQVGMAYYGFYILPEEHTKMWPLLVMGIVYFWGSWLQFREVRIQMQSRWLERQPSPWHLL